MSRDQRVLDHSRASHPLERQLLEEHCIPVWSTGRVPDRRAGECQLNDTHQRALLRTLQVDRRRVFREHVRSLVTALLSPSWCGHSIDDHLGYHTGLPAHASSSRRASSMAALMGLRIEDSRATNRAPVPAPGRSEENVASDFGERLACVDHVTGEEVVLTVLRGVAIPLRSTDQAEAGRVTMLACRGRSAPPDFSTRVHISSVGCPSGETGV